MKTNKARALSAINIKQDTYKWEGSNPSQITDSLLIVMASKPESEVDRRAFN